jgi:hypothetical protein
MVQSTFPSYQSPKNKSTEDKSPFSIILSFRLNCRKRKLTPSPHARPKSIPKNKKDVLAIEIRTLLNSTK